MKNLLTGICLLLCSFCQAQILKSPDDFLGYKLGAAFTPHYKIADYFKDVQVNFPRKVVVQAYGKTYEGKELLLAFVSSPENIANLEEIRKNNLRNTGLLKDKSGNLEGPAIVWLSYNVHGNEPSSSEVAMKVLYELASGNSQYDQWLKNTVVIIDPCLNPDGRDRYVNWFNEIAGKNPSANPLAREHEEPWPGGRVNHYYFDLNRDWAWQTQIETQQRIKKYNQWMPHIHCDFHEQYPSSPYYFAPAAEPFHEVVTTWQRSFQTTIGKNHAKYFDANGWLYFTKEYFDLFYPAYGDTYPMYNGSIGMTYEQAGHSMGGLAIQVNDDTLTLYDRIAHHFTTSMSTIEVASLHAVSIQKEFKKYFDDNKEKGSGKYLSYLLIGGNKNKLSTLIELFDRNDIGYAYAKAGVKINGFHYDNGKEENYTAAAGDIIITAKQPKASLIKVLFEPQSKLADSSTYDITAWSLPYAYGIDCFATTEAIVTEVNMPVNAEPSISRDLYAYLIDYHSVNEGKLLASLLKYGFNVRFAEKDFMYNGKKFDKGTLVILKVNNAAKMDALIALSKQYHAGITGVPSGFMDSGFDFGSDKLRLIKKPVVAMLTGESVSAGSIGEVWHFFEQELDYPIILLQADNIASINLKSIDVLIIPDGDYKILTEKESVLKTWVKQGGKIIACENAVSQMAAGDWGVKIKTDDSIKSDVVKNNYADLKKYGDRDRQSIVNNTPGAIYKVEMDATHPLAFGYPDYYFMLKLNSHLMEFMKDGWNVGVLRNEHEVAGFVGSEARKIIKDGAVIAVQSLGNGNVTYFTDDPLFRSFWENGKLLFINAVFLVGQ